MEYVIFILLVLVAIGVSALFLWGVVLTIFDGAFRKAQWRRAKEIFGFRRSVANPIMQPGQYDFEREAVMNPAAVHDGKETHLFYRAIGADGVSRIGYASSEDGVTIDDRLPYPVFALEGPDPHLAAMRRAYAEEHHPTLVASGGSWGGTEDPRAVIIDDRLYLTFSAFHNWDSVRMGVTSISVPDLQKRKWNWSRPAFLSAPNQVQKNWVLFPEKLQGKFALLHSLYNGSRDRISVDYLNSLNGREPYIESSRNDSSAENVWDSRMRGAGCPPLRTEKGWLQFYHANDNREPHKYKVGALLLDLIDPTRVIARSPMPVLEPDAAYEAYGAKPGIVYVSGATAHDNKLTLYYGAADQTVCAATAPLSEFVNKLFDHKSPTLSIT